MSLISKIPKFRLKNDLDILMIMDAWRTIITEGFHFFK